MYIWMFTGADDDCDCPTGHFLCNDGVTCVAASEVCDGDNDCASGEDESSCSELSNQ